MENTAMTPREIAVETIRQEHRALGAVIHVLQHLLRDIAAEHTEADFRLLASALYYIDDFPERCHHPREERYLFSALRARGPEFEQVLDELESEHVASAHTITHLHRALVHYQADAPQALAALSAGLDAYAAMLSEHMRKEERLLEQAATVLSGDEWSRMAVAFQAEGDPLFGSVPRERYRRLRLRIESLLPRKMRLAVRKGDGHAAATEAETRESPP